MNWISLKDSRQLDEILAESKTQPVIIYKHSTRCNISRSAFDRLERNWDASIGSIKGYFLDLLSNRDISNRIAELFEVEHHSPQILKSFAARPYVSPVACDTATFTRCPHGNGRIFIVPVLTAPRAAAFQVSP